MIEETKPLSFAADGHPDEDQLLLALERELATADAALVEQHLGNCWSCRARSDEMQRGILAFVEYREKRYLPSLPVFTDDSNIFRGRLRNVLGEGSPPAAPIRIWRRLAELFVLPRQARWASAVATVMTLIIFWVWVLHPPVVSANEFLTRAAAAQIPTASTLGGNTSVRVVRQKVRIRSGKESVERDFVWEVGSPDGESRWDSQPPSIAWNAPMTAQGFANWRNSLAEKKDAVERSGDLLTLDTTTGGSPIREARMVVRADDFHPVEQRLRFTNGQELDFTELAYQIEDKPKQAIRPGIGAVDPQPAAAAAVASKADLDDAEMQLRYILFTNRWDLGEDLVIGRASGRVTLSGTVSSPERSEAMRDAVSRLPHLEVAIELPSIANAQTAKSNSAAATSPATSSAPLLRDVLDEAYATREARRAFVDQSLAVSDTALSHAWALKRLVDRYTEPEEQQLSPESGRRYREMLRVHLEELGRANNGLASLLELLPPSSAPAPVVASNSRARILAVFPAVHQQDRLVANLVAGSSPDGPNLTATAAEFRSVHQRIEALLNGLN